jgi:hypothetical protein
VNEAARSAELHLVEPPERTDTEVLLDTIVPTLLVAEKVAARLREMMAKQSRALAKERGVRFIREEQIRQEFGAGD